MVSTREIGKIIRRYERAGNEVRTALQTLWGKRQDLKEIGEELNRHLLNRPTVSGDKLYRHNERDVNVPLSERVKVVR